MKKIAGIFDLNNKIIIRTFSNKKGVITLKSKSKDFADITVKKEDTFHIIGKVLGK